MKNKNLKVLVSAYACGPKWGSEIGMGWNWVIHLAQHCELTVITEVGFKNDIEEVLPTFNLKYLPKFQYIDIGEHGRKLFWKQGSFIFYRYYKRWQLKAYALAKDLVRTNQFDLVHQLNMIGFREPGFLWKIDDIPFVWGPIGGYNQFPWSYLSMLNVNNLFYYIIKNIINKLQIDLLVRPKRAALRANAIFASTNESMKELIKISTVEPLLLNETGCKPALKKQSKKRRTSFLKILWVGKLQGLKALPIALNALATLKNKVDYTLTIIGDGPDEKVSRALAVKLGISEYCYWKGKIFNEDVISTMRESDILFFTSIKEGTPHVVMEAIENGLPVLCHNACGHGATIDDSCGIKIPMKNFKTSISEFSKALRHISQDPYLLDNLSLGALKRANELTWESKALFMINKYNQVIDKNVKIT
jgi:glycosyltransferase involved in cell wall biosynthesis